MIEAEEERLAGREQVVRPLVPGRVERIVAHDGVVVGVAVVPPNGVTGVDGDGERREAVFVRDLNRPSHSAVAVRGAGAHYPHGDERGDHQQDRKKSAHHDLLRVWSGRPGRGDLGWAGSPRVYGRAGEPDCGGILA